MSLTFTKTIAEKKHLAAVTAAREAFNASLPKNDEGEYVNPDDAIQTDQAYLDDRLDAMCSSALQSWASQFGTDVSVFDEQIAELQAKKAAAVEMTK